MINFSCERLGAPLTRAFAFKDKNLKGLQDL